MKLMRGKSCHTILVQYLIHAAFIPRVWLCRLAKYLANMVWGLSCCKFVWCGAVSLRDTLTNFCHILPPNCLPLPHCIVPTSELFTKSGCYFLDEAPGSKQHLAFIGACRMRAEQHQCQIVAGILDARARNDAAEAKRLSTEFSTHPVQSAFHALGVVDFHEKITHVKLHNNSLGVTRLVLRTIERYLKEHLPARK